MTNRNIYILPIKEPGGLLKEGEIFARTYVATDKKTNSEYMVMRVPTSIDLSYPEVVSAVMDYAYYQDTAYNFIKGHEDKRIGIYVGCGQEFLWNTYAHKILLEILCYKDMAHLVSELNIEVDGRPFDPNFAYNNFEEFAVKRMSFTNLSVLSIIKSPIVTNRAFLGSMFVGEYSGLIMGYSVSLGEFFFNTDGSTDKLLDAGIEYNFNKEKEKDKKLMKERNENPEHTGSPVLYNKNNKCLLFKRPVDGSIVGVNKAVSMSIATTMSGLYANYYIDEDIYFSIFGEPNSYSTAALNANFGDRLKEYNVGFKMRTLDYGDSTRIEYTFDSNKEYSITATLSKEPEGLRLSELVFDKDREYITTIKESEIPAFFDTINSYRIMMLEEEQE